MRNRSTHWMAATGLLAVAGCGSLGTILDFLSTDQITVELVNASPDFDVDVVLYYGDEQDTIETLLKSFGTKVERTVSPGSTATITRDCDDLQAVMIDDADLRVIAGISPDADTGVYRDGDDFNCGDTVTFTFDHGALLVDFDIDVEVR